MISFDDALDARLHAEVLDRCTSCGKCAAVCPMPAPAGLQAETDAESRALAGGIVDFLRGGEATPDSLAWAESCTGSGYCIEACPEAVNPRFMLALARVERRKRAGPDAARANGRRSFGTMSNAVRAFSRLQLPAERLARINPGKADGTGESRAPEVVYYTGCNMLRTPHIGLLCLEILDAMGVSYEVKGGPGACCGILQFREGDTETAEKIAGRTLDGFAATRAPEVLAWCPSCVVQFAEINLPTFEHKRQEPAPFEMVAFYIWLANRLDDLKPLMTKPLNRRVALVERPGIPGAREAAVEICKATPGVEYVALPDVQRIGISSTYLTLMPDFKEKLRREEFDACVAAGVDTLATIFHPCHRDICHLGEGQPFEVVNLMDLVGESMGIHVDDILKRLKIIGDIDAILAECSDLIEEHALNIDALRTQLETEIVGAKPTGDAVSKD